MIKKNIEQKLNIKREKEIIIKPKGSKVNILFQTLFNLKTEIPLYINFTIKEVKIIYNLITGIPYRRQRYVFYGKALEDNRVL